MTTFLDEDDDDDDAFLLAQWKKKKLSHTHTVIARIWSAWITTYSYDNEDLEFCCDLVWDERSMGRTRLFSSRDLCLSPGDLTHTFY